MYHKSMIDDALVERVLGSVCLNECQRREAKDAAESLKIAERLGVLKKSHLNGICLDFGCGQGGSSSLLHMLGANVTAIDMDANALGELRDLQIIPDEQIKCVEGLEYVGGLEKGSCDLITAFSLGPDPYGPFLKAFWQVSTSAIKPDGIIVISSDVETLSAAKRVIPSSLWTLKGQTMILAVQPEDLFEACFF